MNKKVVVFEKGYQKRFIEENVPLNTNLESFSYKCGISYGTLAKSYRYEICNMNYEVFTRICGLKRLNEKYVLKKYKAFIRYQLSPIGRKAFGERRVKLPETKGFVTTNKIKLKVNEIKYSRYDYIKKIKFPLELSPSLAEEIGMHLGDGFLSDRKYEYRLKGNKDEIKYYDDYIKMIFKKLYDVEVPIKEYENTYGFEFHSMALWNFKTKVLGIKPGKKDDIDIPEMIKKTKNPKILTAFTRGLMDTDGSISFSNRYKLGNYYPVISISLKSKKVIFGLRDIMNHLGLKPVMSQGEGKWRIDLNGYERLEVYSKLIGWSNPKHLNKVKLWKIKYPKLGMVVVA